MNPNKKYLDIKIVSPTLISTDYGGHETIELNCQNIFKTDKYYDMYKPKRKISDKKFKEAIRTVISKFVQEGYFYISVDLDMFNMQEEKIKDKENEK